MPQSTPSDCRYTRIGNWRRPRRIPTRVSRRRRRGEGRRRLPKKRSSMSIWDRLRPRSPLSPFCMIKTLFYFEHLAHNVVRVLVLLCPFVPTHAPDIDASAADLALPFYVGLALRRFFTWVLLFFAWVFFFVFHYDE